MLVPQCDCILAPQALAGGLAPAAVTAVLQTRACSSWRAAPTRSGRAAVTSILSPQPPTTLLSSPHSAGIRCRFSSDSPSGFVPSSTSPGLGAASAASSAFVPLPHPPGWALLHLVVLSLPEGGRRMAKPQEYQRRLQAPQASGAALPHCPRLAAPAPRWPLSCPFPSDLSLGPGVGAVAVPRPEARDPAVPVLPFSF
jgi:hypothetical protein